MSIVKLACNAYAAAQAEAAEKERAALVAERRRHYDGARRLMEEQFSLSEAVIGGWGPTSFVDHERTITSSSKYVKDRTVTQPAVEFVADGLCFRVLETRPRRDYIDGHIGYLRRGIERAKELPEYGYQAYVRLPCKRPFLRWFTRTDECWIKVSSKARLGALLAERGMCCSS